METYRLSSKLVESEREFVIQTGNDVKVCAVQSTVFVDGEVAGRFTAPHPMEFTAEEVLSLVKTTHDEKKREVEVMLHCYNDAIKGNDAKAMYRLGTAFFYRRFLNEARNLLNGAIAINDNLHQAYNYLGMTELEYGNCQAAVTAARVATQMRPGFADYQYNLGRALLASSRYSQAVLAFKKAVGTNLYYADACFSLGMALLANAVYRKDQELFKGVVSKTIDSLRKAAVIDPAYDTEVLHEAIKALEGSDLEVSLALIDKVYETRRESRYSEIAEHYVKYVYQYSEISEETVLNRIAYLRGELSKNPTYADLHTDMANCLLKRARMAWHESVVHFRKALDINPELTDVENALNLSEQELESMTRIVDSVVSRR